MRIAGRAAARRPTAAGMTRVERAARARRRRALAHLERVRDQREASNNPPARRLRALVLALSFAGGAWAGSAWLADATLETISVRGARHLSAQAIAAASGVAPGAPLAALDRDSVAARLAENAWIEQARALALPSGRLLLAVVEREPVAVLAGEEPWAVDAAGSPFAPAPSEGLEALPRLVATHATAPGELAQAVALARRLPELGLASSARGGHRGAERSGGAIAAASRPGAARGARPGGSRRQAGGPDPRSRSGASRAGERHAARSAFPGPGGPGCHAAPERDGTSGGLARRRDAVQGTAGRVIRRPLMGGNMSRKEELIVGLDIGTTKICVIVAERTENGIDVVGIGTHPSRGLRKGVVVDIDATVDSIKHAIEEAELMADCEITTVYAGIAGGHIRGFNSHGVVAVKDREVREGDVRRVIDAAKAVAIPMDREVIHVIPQEFIIDDQDGIREPLGMSGVRLEAKIHIVTAAVTSAQNIVKCANRAGLNVMDIVLEPLASAEAALADDERDLGVCLVDIGGGTTDIAVFADGSIKHTSVLGLGGYHISNDIAVGLRTPFEEAERIKKKFGMATARYLPSDDVISVPSVGGRRPRQVSRKILCEIIEPRVDEILSLARRELVKAGLEDRIPSGVVLTGGCSALAGLPELAEEIFEAPVRPGTPSHIGGLQDVVRGPMYATGVGLALFGASRSSGASHDALPHPGRLHLRQGQAAHAGLVLRGDSASRDGPEKWLHLAQKRCFHVTFCAGEISRGGERCPSEPDPAPNEREPSRKTGIS